MYCSDIHHSHTSNADHSDCADREVKLQHRIDQLQVGKLSEMIDLMDRTVPY